MQKAYTLVQKSTEVCTVYSMYSMCTVCVQYVLYTFLNSGSNGWYAFTVNILKVSLNI